MASPLFQLHMQPCSRPNKPGPSSDPSLAETRAIGLHPELQYVREYSELIRPAESTKYSLLLYFLNKYRRFCVYIYPVTWMEGFSCVVVDLTTKGEGIWNEHPIYRANALYRNLRTLLWTSRLEE